MVKKRTRINRTRLIVYLLAAYVLMQFTWWAISLLRLNEELRASRLGQSGTQDSYQVESDYTDRLWMVLGEGSVFLLLLLLAIWFVLRALKREQRFQKRQSEFLAMFTHELKSPIASIRLALQTLARGRAKPEQRTALFAAAEEETRHLERMTDLILQSSRLTFHASLWAQEPICLSVLVKDTTARIAPGRLGNIEVNVEADVWIMGDAIAFETVVSNLLENAWRHTPQGTKVKVGLSTRGEHCLLTVSDEGAGISAKERNNIFRRFYRKDVNPTRNAKGSGLGLFLVKGLVELHNGKVWVSDNDPQGATFNIQLQLK